MLSNSLLGNDQVWSEMLSQELTFMDSTDGPIYEGNKVGQTGGSCCNSGSDSRFQSALFTCTITSMGKKAMNSDH